MRRPRIDLNLLVSLDVLLRERNVTRASEQLHITQSAMSGVLARLRDHFGDPLLVPVGRTLRLTPLAEGLVEPVREVVLRIDSALATRPAFDPKEARRHFIIVASDYVCRVLLADVVRRVAREAPHLTFDLQPTDADMMQELDAGNIDFIVAPAHLARAEHPQAVLFEDTYRVVACAQNPLLGETLGLEQYHALGHVVYLNERSANPWFEQWYLNQYGPTRRVEVITHGFALMPRFIVGTTRIATVQTRLAIQFAQSMPVRLFELPMETPKLTEVLQWHRYRDGDPGSQWMREQLIAGAARLPHL